MRRQIVMLTTVLIAITAILIPQALAQVDPNYIIGIDMPRQTVEAVRDGVKIKAQVRAKIRIRPDGRARGKLYWKSRADGKVVIQAIEGRGFFDEENVELVRVHLEFREANGELVAATVTRATSNEDCLIWDLINGTTGQSRDNNFPERVSFEASGEISVREASR